MGLFSSKKKTYVSSVVYNLAGDVKDRPNYLKTVSVGHVLEGGQKTYTRNLLDSYLGGPGVSLRQFGHWARTQGYNQNVGLVQSKAYVPATINTEALREELAAIKGKPVYVNEAEIGVADYGMWANQFMLENRYGDYLKNWSADFDEATTEITISVPGSYPSHLLPLDYSTEGQYLYVSLNQEKEASSSVEEGAWESTPADTLGFTLDSTSIEVRPLVLASNTVVTRGELVQEFPETTPVDVELKTVRYVKRDNLPDPISSLTVGHMITTLEVVEQVSIEESVFTDSMVEADRSVTVVNKTTQIAKKTTLHRTTVEQVRSKAWGNEEIFIYRKGSGNAVLDAFFDADRVAGSYFPIIPLRVDNRFINSSWRIYPWVRKAIRRATNTTFEDLVGKIAKNRSLGDIDYAYIVFGVSLNTPDNAGKRYLYEYFRNIGLAAPGAQMSDFWARQEAAMKSWNAWILWYTTLRHTNNQSYFGRPSVPPPEPGRQPFPGIPKFGVRVRSSQNYDMYASFSGITETVHDGKFSAVAKLGDLRISRGTKKNVQRYREQYGDSESGVASQWVLTTAATIESVFIYWQDKKDSYRRLEIANLQHTNWVYGGKSVNISGWEALSSAAESGFIIPLQEETLKRLPLTTTTQLCTASTYLVFNCYQVVEQKWYQSGIFKVIIAVVAIVIAVYSGGASAGATGGLLGSNAVVGAAIGFTGTAAIVAGAIANAVASMVVSQLISAASKAAFGDKLGSLIGAIASVVAVSVGSSMAGGQSLSASFGNMLKAENLLQLTSSIGNGLTEYIQASTVEIQNQTAEVMSEYQQQAKAIAEKYAQEFGGTGFIDPLAVTNVSAFQLEDPSTFFDRTLMNGTDIANMSHDLLDNFPSMTVALPLE